MGFGLGHCPRVTYLSRVMCAYRRCGWQPSPRLRVVATPVQPSHTHLLTPRLWFTLLPGSNFSLEIIRSTRTYEGEFTVLAHPLAAQSQACNFSQRPAFAARLGARSVSCGRSNTKWLDQRNTENIHGRVEPLYPTVNVLCAFSAVPGERALARYANLPEIRTHFFRSYFLL